MFLLTKHSVVNLSVHITSIKDFFFFDKTYEI